MKINEQMLNTKKNEFKEEQFEGLYGIYKITYEDKLEVQKYRFSLLICGLSFFLGLIHWLFIGPSIAWIWLIPLVLTLGSALLWIHIYLQILHKALQFLWLIGSIGLLILAINLEPEKLLSSIVNQPKYLLFIGPLFASMAGVGFKEFFCFGRIEAIGVTLLLPLALLGHITTILNGELVMTMLLISSLMLLILAIRKFGMKTESDLGDKSIFEYLKSQKNIQHS